MFRSRSVLLAVVAVMFGVTIFESEAGARPCRRPRHRRHYRVYCPPRPCCPPCGQPTYGLPTGGIYGTCQLCPTTVLVDYGKYKCYQLTVCPNTNSGTIDGNFINPQCPNGPGCQTVLCAQVMAMAKGNKLPNNVDPDLCKSGLDDFVDETQYPQIKDPDHVKNNADYYVTFDAMGGPYFAHTWKYNKKDTGDEFRSAYQVKQIPNGVPMEKRKSGKVTGMNGYCYTVQVDGTGDELIVIMVKQP